MPRRSGRRRGGGATDVLDEAIADVYVWAYPLLAVHRTRAATAAAGGSGLRARDRLTTARDRTVVAPNNDTLYASGFFDLGRGDLTVSVEPMDGPWRYWSVMLLDAYTNVRYICRRLHGNDGCEVRVAYDPNRAPDEATPDTVRVGTPTVWVMVRVLAAAPEDLPAARHAMAGIRVHQTGADGGATDRQPERDPDVGYLVELRDALAADPPAAWHPPPPATLEDLLADPPPDDVVLAGRREGAARIRAHGPGRDAEGNVWGTRRRGAAFGDDVLYRAAFARFSLAGHLPAENRSYNCVVDGRQSRWLHFPRGERPPVGAFWSLCLYGPDLFFVDNPLDRYSLSDRSPSLRPTFDGSLTIEIGHHPPPDPSNWLPAPDGPCVLVLRAYEGAPDVVAARWFPPALQSRPPVAA
jgi:hypothetical protein